MLLMELLYVYNNNLATLIKRNVWDLILVTEYNLILALNDIYLLCNSDVLL